MSAVWNNYEALYNHFNTELSSPARSSTERSTYNGLFNRISSSDFLIDLALMYDVLFELSSLSIFLQTRCVNILQAHKAITRTINVFTKWNDQTEETDWCGGIGSKSLEASLATRDMKFNSVKLTTNPRHIHIPQKTFLKALITNLQLRLITVSCNLNTTERDRLTDRNEYKLLVDNFSVLVKEYWPHDVSADYGTNQIKYLCKRFNLDFACNLQCFRSYLDCDGKSIPAGLVPLLNVLKIIPISTSKDERGFSSMNSVCTDLRNSLTIEITSAILFIKINGPPVAQFLPDKYVKYWLRTHNDAESNRNTGRDNSATKEIINKKCWEFL